MMNYIRLDTLLSAIQTLVRGTNEFKDVVISNATDTGKLLEEMEAAAPPAAIIGIGDIEYGEDGVQRTLRPVIVVLDTFRRGNGRRASSVWTIGEKVERLFQPSLEAGGDYRELCGIPFCLSRLSPLALSDRLAAVAISIEGTEFI